MRSTVAAANAYSLRITGRSSEEKVQELHEQGLMEGDAAFDEQGICRSVTFPRCNTAINGKREDGTPLSREYETGKLSSRS